MFRVSIRIVRVIALDGNVFYTVGDKCTQYTQRREYDIGQEAEAPAGYTHSSVVVKFLRVTYPMQWGVRRGVRVNYLSDHDTDITSKNERH